MKRPTKISFITIMVMIFTVILLAYSGCSSNNQSNKMINKKALMIIKPVVKAKTKIEKQWNVFSIQSKTKNDYNETDNPGGDYSFSIFGRNSIIESTELPLPTPSRVDDYHITINE